MSDSLDSGPTGIIKSIASIHYFPIKSCSGITVSSAYLSARGLRNDRIGMIVDKEGRFLTQREIPKMALIKVDLLPALIETESRKPSIVSQFPDFGGFKLDAEDMSSLAVPICENLAESTVRVWDDTCASYDLGEEAADWLSTVLGVSVRLVAMPDSHRRIVDAHVSLERDAITGFSDAFPLLIISSSSLSELNNRLDSPVPMSRFRPNLVIDGCEPFEEDLWKSFKIIGREIAHEIILDSPCSRCVITTIDQSTARASSEPLKTLATFRKFAGKVNFGMNAIHSSEGEITVGDLLEVTFP